MTPPRNDSSTRSDYTPESDRRETIRRDADRDLDRDVDRESGDAPKPWFRRMPRPSEFLAGLALIALVLPNFGFRYQPQDRELAEERVARVKADSLLQSGIDRAKDRIDDLSYQQALTNFLLCDARSRNGSHGTPASGVPTECLPILKAWSARQ